MNPFLAYGYGRNVAECFELNEANVAMPAVLSYTFGVGALGDGKILHKL